MKKILSINPDSATTDIALLIARVGIAALMLTHGVPKLIMLFSEQPVQFPPVMGMSSKLSLTLTVFAEVIGSLFVLVGLGTRLASVFLGFTMSVAAFYIHTADPFSVEEMSLHFLLVYIILIVAGSGRYSVDYRLQTKSVSAQKALKTKNTAIAA
jgi:putative oxidoreductase